MSHQCPICSGGSVAACPHPRQMPRAVPSSFFHSLPTRLSSVSSAFVPSLAPVGRAALGKALPVYGLSSPPHAVPSQLILPLLTVVHSLKCFLKELRSCFVSVGVLQRKRTIRICVCRERFILRNWLSQLWRLASLKSIQQASWLETQAGFLGCRLEAEFLLQETSSFLLRPSTDLVGPTPQRGG